MTNSAEFPELGPHPEFDKAEINELLPATKETIDDIWTAATMLAKDTAFGFAANEKWYEVMSMPEGTIPTGVVASITVHDITTGSAPSSEKLLYNVIKQEDLSIQKLFLGQNNQDYGSINNPEDIVRFKQAMFDFEQKRKQAEAMGFLEVSQKESEDLLSILTSFTK